MAATLTAPKSSTKEAEKVTRYVRVIAQLEALEKERTELRDDLVQKGSRELRGLHNEIIQAVYPAPKIVIEADKVGMIEAKIGAENFKTLIEPITVWKAVKSCRDVAARILTSGQYRRFLALTEKECSPYLKIL